MNPRGDGFPDATPVTRARADVLLDALNGCDRPQCEACERKRELVDRLIQAVREEERQRAMLERAGIPPEHL